MPPIWWWPTKRSGDRTARPCGAEGRPNAIWCGLIRGWWGHPEVVVQYGDRSKPTNNRPADAQSDIDGVLVGWRSAGATRLRPHRQLPGGR